jgi:hypothetical protein
MAEATDRPIYTPPAQIRTGLYTEGKEFMDADTLEEYVGLYHSYPNNAVYTQGSYDSDSKKLATYAGQTQEADLLDTEGKLINERTPNNSIYFKLTEKRFDRHHIPIYYYPEPSKEVYESGFFNRFFAQRVNDENDITEINEKEFQYANEDNTPGIDLGLYKKYKLKWSVIGPVDECRKANSRVISNTIKQGCKGLDRFLTDLDEYHKNRHKIPEDEFPDIQNNLYTAGGEYQTTNGKEYKGPYHIHPEKGAMIGKKHTSQPHAYLQPIQSKNTDQDPYFNQIAY